MSALVTMFSIFEAFKHNSRQVMRGENACKSGHVKTMKFDSAVHPMILLGEVLASMRNKSYTVEITYDTEKGIQSMKCSCPRGQAICHHMAALLFHCHYNISSTDHACQWKAPKQSSTDDTPQTLDDMYPVRPFCASKRNLSSVEILEFRNKLSSTSVVGFSWLLKPEITKEFLDILPSIEAILYSQEYLEAEDKKAYFLEKCAVPEAIIEKISKDTIGQHSNEKWLVSRKLRLTSSKFGIILSACKRRRYPKSLMKTLVEGYDLHKVLAVQWGKDCEQTALKKFIEQSNTEVTPTGMWIDRSGIIASSPDGLIEEDGVLEIKCPYKYRIDSLKAGVQDKKYVFYYENDEIIVQKDHPYYHQIQGQLYLTNRKYCLLFIWTPNEYQVIRIEKDLQWSSNIAILENFYFNVFLSYILSNKYT